MKVLHLVIFSLISTFAIAQNLKVVHVSGDIYSDKVKRNLVVGDQIDPNEKLSYTGSGLSCFLFDGKNRLSFKPNENNSSGTVTDLFQPPIKRQLIASRGSEDSSYLSIKDYFANENYLFFNQNESFILSPSKIEDNNSLRYFVVDDSDQKKELKFSNGIISIDNSFLFPNQEKNIELIFYKINTSNGEINKLCKVNFHNASEISVKEQIKLIVSMQDKSDEEKVKMETFSILQSIYGNLNEENWNNFFNLNFK